jgi:uncharacterized protein (TIGR02996 family)
MNVADSILLALADAPGDRTPALVLADWLEEHDTPATRALAPLVRLAAEKRTPDWRKRMRAARATLAKRPQAAGWFDWWFGASFGPTFRMIQKPDAPPLIRFGIRCIRELPAGGQTIFEVINDETCLRGFERIERLAAGNPLPDDDRETLRQVLWRAAQALHGQGNPLAFPAWAVVTLFGVAFPRSGAGVALMDTQICAWYCLRAAYDVPPVRRHKVSPQARVLGILRATVPCPFDPEADS